MVRSLSSGILPQHLLPADRLRINEVANFDDAMACLIAACQSELAARNGNPKVFAPVTAICSTERLLAAAASARDLYREELLAMEARVAAELFHTNDAVFTALGKALVEHDYSDLVL